MKPLGKWPYELHLISAFLTLSVWFVDKTSHLQDCTFGTSSVYVNCQFSISIKNSSIISTVKAFDCFL